jgi:PPOX class probable F420-dependent enzyme
MATDPADLPPGALEFVRERHLATLTTLRRDGTPHVTPAGFTWDPDRLLARVITSGTSQKVRNVLATERAVLCQVDRRRWISLEGSARVSDLRADVRDAEERYAARYRTPRPNPRRVVIEIRVRQVLGNV